MGAAFGPPKAIRVLEALVDARGEVVTRTALRKMLWTEDTFVDFDNNLNSAVATLRHVLARPESTSRHIETTTSFAIDGKGVWKERRPYVWRRQRN